MAKVLDINDLIPSGAQGVSLSPGDGYTFVPIMGPSTDPLSGYGTVVIGYIRVRSPAANAQPNRRPSSYEDPAAREQRVWVPPVAGDPGVPPSLYQDPEDNLGWNAEAESIERLSGDVVASFLVGENPRVLIGFAVENTDGVHPTDIQSGVLVQPGGAEGTMVLQLVRNGGVVGTPSGAIGMGRITLLRAFGSLRVSVDGNEIQSVIDPSRGACRLRAMLYTSNDQVLDPSFSNTGVKNLAASLPLRPAMSLSAAVRGALGMEGSVYGALDGVRVTRVSGVLPLRGVVTSRWQVNDTVSASTGLWGGAPVGVVGFPIPMPGLRMLASDRPYAQITSSLPSIRIRARTGVPSPDVAGVNAVLRGFGMSTIARSGYMAGAHLITRHLHLLASDRPYCQGTVTLPMTKMAADDGLPIPNYKLHLEPMDMRDFAFPDPDLFASITFGLGLEPTMTLGTLVADELFEGLVLDPSFTVRDYLEVLIREGITLSSATAAPRSGYDLGQYAFNLDSGAATRYDNFEFDGFAFSPSATYAFRKDGVFRLRTGDDDGYERSALVDFGTEALSGMAKAHIETIYLGLSTDGEVYMKMQADGGRDRVYRVVQNSPTMRIHTGRGVTAREWGTTLQIVDSTSAELDGIEFVVSASGRKWTR